MFLLNLHYNNIISLLSGAGFSWLYNDRYVSNPGAKVEEGS